MVYWINSLFQTEHLFTFYRPPLTVISFTCLPVSEKWPRVHQSVNQWTSICRVLNVNHRSLKVLMCQWVWTLRGPLLARWSHHDLLNVLFQVSNMTMWPWSRCPGPFSSCIWSKSHPAHGNQSYEMKQTTVYKHENINWKLCYRSPATFRCLSTKSCKSFRSLL